MPPSMRAISQTELDVLKTLWDHGDSTVREVQEHLESLGRTWAYTTVQTFLFRLQQKKLVRSDKSGRAHVFRAAVSRDALLSEHIDDLAERVGGGTVPLMASLVQGRRFSPAEIQELRRLLDDVEAEAARDRRDGKTTKKAAPGATRRPSHS
ncbi:MAG: BlaI/MecI/CopY family transcriptional regulator [Planctomycetes bacterium]|nr:BlaI/MecI/CopY family transcriptional regulator [Planctomycetota bacterium]MBI3845012.1 BlaI/MecI/CopY family transcriptional regulator [Planctomycetota bacterium]